MLAKVRAKLSWFALQTQHSHTRPCLCAGDAGENGAEPGNLVVVFEVGESHLFQRSGDDVLSQVNISYFDAVIGATMLIQSIYGTQIPLQCVPLVALYPRL